MVDLFCPFFWWRRQPLSAYWVISQVADRFLLLSLFHLSLLRAPVDLDQWSVISQDSTHSPQDPTHSFYAKGNSGEIFFPRRLKPHFLNSVSRFGNTMKLTSFVVTSEKWDNSFMFRIYSTQQWNSWIIFMFSGSNVSWPSSKSTSHWVYVISKPV